MSFSNKCLYCNKQWKIKNDVSGHTLYVPELVLLIDGEELCELLVEGAEGVDLAQPGPHVLQDMEESQLYIYSHHLSFNKLLHLEIGQSMHQAGESFFVENLGNIFRRMIPEKILFVLFVTT